jgi:hypothetical protein
MNMNSVPGRVRGLLCRILLVATLCSPFAAATAQVDPAGGIYIVGALHRLHEKAAGFDYEALRRLIDAVNPQVMLTEARPDELSGRTDTPGRPEYPKVVWPWLAGHADVIALPMEPGGELFQKWVGEATAKFEQLAQSNPQGSAYWSRYQASLSKLLSAHWTTPADAHDALTSDMARSWYLVQYGIGGKDFETGQERWDGYMIDRAREAVRAHPAKRILVLASYRNRHRFDQALREEQGARVVEMEAWLRRLPDAATAKPAATKPAN